MAGHETTLKIAVMDLYDGIPNQGMRGIREILDSYAKRKGLNTVVKTFDVRQSNAIPDTSWDVYISSGGPGSPIDSEGSEWDDHYFSLIKDLEDHNASSHPDKKFGFFICHSFQLMCRHYTLGNVCKRKSPSYGVMPVNKWEDGFEEPLFAGLPDPFFAVDSREWQVISPDRKQLQATGAKIIALEKERPHVPLERALMGVRFSEYFAGTQFHPEADPTGMTMYLQQEDKKKQVIAEHGEEKYYGMIGQLHHPGKILLTRNTIIPAFLDRAVQGRSLSFSDQPLAVNSR